MSNAYTLSAEADRRVEAEGMSGPNWFRPPVDSHAIRALMEKRDAPAIRDTVIWIGVMIVTAGMAIALWPSWWSAPFWAIYGVMYGSASDARWHECGHRTAFKTKWMNEVVYHIAAFMLMRSPTVWRASHVRHHTDTVIVGRDPEIVAMRPPDLLRVVLNLFGLLDVPHLVRRMVLHASGQVHPEEAMYLRPADYPRVFLVARIWVAIYAVVIGLALWMGSILPFMLAGLPRMYGAWHHVLTGLLQHLGLAENVTDHRLNTRTVLMNPVSRFIYLNMNYHLEHHMFTMVPYYNLPKLHGLIADQVPAPEPSVWAAFQRLLPVLVKQLTYREAVIIPELPPGAAPYRAEVERLRPFAA
ncbi:Fatty acid desaturase [Jannaschia faecimaris]|uniref:Fatty acid desaturase n=1 Tax=Jannaschia faecimaris TaxID=1244108 RepID=A0A1H3ITS7_9RHOB|nr:fatty acid desaturase [Jannaschia faecimaris]SDY31111.1 Fatty acid desaturase [Jannaschia faecimaris]